MAVNARPRLALLFPIGLLAVFLLLLAWPRLLASVRYLPVERAIAGYHATGAIPSARLPALIGFAAEAIGRHDDYRYHEGLGTLHLLRAMDFATPALERRAAYVSAMEATEEALRRAPARPSAWLRLAAVRWILHEENDAIVEAWKMSVFTGRMHSALFANRVEIGLAHYDYLDAEGRAMLRDQLLLAWRLRPGPLVQVLQRRDGNLRLTRRLLADSAPVALAEIEQSVEKRRR